MNEPPLIELRTCYVFDCEECGRENLVRPIAVEMTDEIVAELVELDEYDHEPGHWVRMPETVACGHCGARFSTLDDR